MAGRASLAYLGQEDLALSADPEVTYFIEKYAGSTPFSQRVDRVIFDEAGVNFGTENHITVPRSGDLMTDMYLFIQMPTIPQNVSVLDSVGTLMFQYVELYIGTELIERLYGEYIEMKYDLEVPKGKQNTLKTLIGKTLQFQNTPNATYTIPLPFSLFEKGLPLCAFDDHVTIRIVWSPSTFFTVTQNAQGVVSTPPTPLGPFIAYLNVEYTYLAQKEIDFIRQGNPRRQIFKQIQKNMFFIKNGTQNALLNLEFYNPVDELYFIVQNDQARGYDYSNTATVTSNTLGTTDLLQSLQLSFNVTDRIQYQVGTPQFLRIIQGLEFHTRVPDRLFSMYSFSLDPEGPSPSGSVNLSRIKNQILNINLNQTPTNVNVRVYAKSYNFLETANGKAKVVFSNFY